MKSRSGTGSTAHPTFIYKSGEEMEREREREGGVGWLKEAKRERERERDIFET